MTDNPEKNWFGNRAVSPEEKTGLVRGVFDSVAERYDLMNDLMSLGVHRKWKADFIRMIRPQPGLNYLDVAGGTGDIAFKIKKKLDQKTAQNANTPASNITLLDLTYDMLSVGRDRALDKGYGTDFNWICGNAEMLPLKTNSQDIYTISFGLRNVTHIDTALAEAHRVLKPGGRFYCMEFSHVQVPVFDKLYYFYSDALIPRLGEKVAQDRDSYQYLVESIRKFPPQSQLKKRMNQVGFKHTKVHDFTFGVVAVHSGIKA
jgi:demethylmenaquinone methyltransferase / 2-methoxy-6-polyprenyl-1,4-benzoquinol methylase